MLGASWARDMMSRPGQCLLGRRPLQTIGFPELGITIQVVESSHSVAPIGIAAPREIKILREEVYGKIVESDPEAFAVDDTPSKENHALRNRLDSANLAIHVARRHIEAHRVQEAQAALDMTFNEFRDLNTIIKFWGEKPFGVLLVEDDNNDRELLAGFLRSSGFDVTTAAGSS